MDGAEALETYRTEMERRVGKSHRHYLGTVDGRMIRRYALAIGELNPIYYDQDAAREAGFAGLVAPPNMLSAIVEWGTGADERDLTADGVARGAATGGLRIMGAGEQMILLRPVTEGVELFAEETVEKVEAKHGRSGALVFVTVRHDFVDAEGTVYNCNRRTVLARS